MRRTDREVQDMLEIFDSIQRCSTIRIGVQGEEYPYVVPVSFGAELINGMPVIYFHCAEQGLKLDLLRRNPKVCVEGDIVIRVEPIKHGITARYESFIGFGTYVEMVEPEEKIRGLKLLTEHYGYMDYPIENCGALKQVVVGKIILQSITGKRNLPKEQRKGE